MAGKKKQQVETLTLDHELLCELMSRINTGALDHLGDMKFDKELYNVVFSFIQLGIMYHYYAGGNRESFEGFVNEFLNYSDKHRDELVQNLEEFFDSYFSEECQCEDCKAKEEPVKDLN